MQDYGNQFLSLRAPRTRLVQDSHRQQLLTFGLYYLRSRDEEAMRSFLLAFAIVALCLLPMPLRAQQGTSDAEIKAAIARLSDDADKNGIDNFAVLYKNPRRSTEILISSLKPVRRGQYLSNHHPQVVWNIRALRSLTGLDFRAPTKADLSEEEAHFLDHDAKTDEVCFFGTWMSRDRVWVAPLDAQTAIIRKWEMWFEHHGRTFSYVHDKNFDNWYF